MVGWNASSGEDRNGEPGYSHFASCSTGAEGPGMVVDAGWSKDPNAKSSWTGGVVSGVIGPDRKALLRLVSSEGLGGLAASAPPSLDSIPNNHRFYAAQWFFLAFAALVIYLLALLKRLKAMPQLQDLIWAQEEPKNNGAWTFVEDILEQCLGEAGFNGMRAQYAGRDAGASPATGLAKRHAAEQSALIEAALGHSSRSEGSAVAAE